MDATWHKSRRPYQPSPWTEEAVARLRAMVLEGCMTRMQIADALGLSKSAICGMVWRLGLADKRRSAAPGARKHKRIRNRKPRPKAPRRPRPIPEVPQMIQVIGNVEDTSPQTETNIPDIMPPFPLRPVDAPPAPACDFMALGYHTCRWPLWGLGWVPFYEQFYCGAEPLSGGAPYCAEHTRRGFAPSRPPTRGRMLVP